jgi:hypothetical protein
MIAFKESERIDWVDLFEHHLFKSIKDADEVRIRKSIGRDILGESESLML